MIRPLLLVAAAAACTRTPPATPPAPRVASATPAESPAAAFARARETHRQYRVMRRAANISRFPGTEQGARDLALALSHAAASGDAARLREVTDELTPDDPRVELGLTYDGARALRDRIIPTAAPRLDALHARLAALREPLAVEVRSALGHELATPTTGLDPRLATLAPQLRPAVRFFRVEVRGADPGEPVVLEPMAWLGARWTWLGTALPDAPPVTVPAPTTPSRRRI
ncbi:MAG: hypothetical protein U0325_01715 [Polyangiales bacterium]